MLLRCGMIFGASAMIVISILTSSSPRSDNRRKASTERDLMKHHAIVHLMEENACQHHNHQLRPE